jgi:hypothetical protein
MKDYLILKIIDMESTLPLNDQGKISEILNNVENYKSFNYFKFFMEKSNFF